MEKVYQDEEKIYGYVLRETNLYINFNIFMIIILIEKNKK